MLLEAQIRADMILGYPWMQRKGYLLDTKLGCLITGKQNQWYLQSWQGQEMTDASSIIQPLVSRRLREPQKVSLGSQPDGNEWADKNMCIQLRKLQLAVPNDGGTECGADENGPEEERVNDPLSDTELEDLQAKIYDSIQEVEVSGLIQGEESEWGEHQVLVDELRATIHWDYDSTILSGKFHWGPEGAPIRGDNCEAFN